MDWEFIAKYTPEFIHAGILTLKIGGIGIMLSIVVGILGSWVLYENFKFFKQIIIGYVELSRNTPLLVQLFFLYYGLPKIGIKFSPELCGIIGLTFLGGSYMIETFRSALETIDKIQKESALSLGMTKWQTMRYVILPQSFVISLPGLTANIIFMLKETSVFSAISLIDMMFVTKDLIGLYYKTEESLFMLVVGYLIILLPLSLFGVWLERKLKYVGYSNWFIIKRNKFRKTSLWFMDNNKIKFNFCNFISNFWNTFWAFYGYKESFNKDNLSSLPPNN